MVDDGPRHGMQRLDSWGARGGSVTTMVRGLEDGSFLNATKQHTKGLTESLSGCCISVNFSAPANRQYAQGLALASSERLPESKIAGKCSSVY